MLGTVYHTSVFVSSVNGHQRTEVTKVTNGYACAPSPHPCPLALLQHPVATPRSPTGQKCCSVASVAEGVKHPPSPLLSSARGGGGGGGVQSFQKHCNTATPPATRPPERPRRRSPGAKRPLRRGFNRQPGQPHRWGRLRQPYSQLLCQLLYGAHSRRGVLR